jgi:hypothetical protein
MDYTSFARELITTGELDPVYTMMYNARAEMGDDWVSRYCMHFLMFYAAEEAAKAADQPDFWKYVKDNYDTCRRGSERRYFRGEAGRASIQSLDKLGSPESVFQELVQPLTLPKFRKRLAALGIKGFGDYFMLKWADYADKVFLAGINYEHLPFMLPSPPLKCFKTVWPDMYVKDAMDMVTGWISDLDDPFSGKQKCGYSEAETIACAIPSYLIKKRYKMGDDIRKYERDLKDFPHLTRLLP